MREQTNKRTSHAGKTNILQCPRDKPQQQSNKKNIGHEATTNKQLLMPEKLKQSLL